MGYAHAWSGHVREGFALLEEALAAQQRMGFRAYEARCAAQLGEVSVLAGRYDDGLRFARLALTIAREVGERGHEAHALRLLGEIAAQGDRTWVEPAAEHYREALALAAELGMRPLVAHCHLGLGKLYTRTDKREQAREHLATATTMYHEMGMTYWLEKAEAEEPGG
jgi:tetratricopeptide (TPR) repeat protein